MAESKEVRHELTEGIDTGFELAVSFILFIALLVSVVLPVITYELLFHVFTQCSLGILAVVISVFGSISYSLFQFRLINHLVIHYLDNKKEMVKGSLIILVLGNVLFLLVLGSAVLVSPEFSMQYVLLNFNRFIPYIIGYLVLVIISSLLLLVIVYGLIGWLSKGWVKESQGN